MPGAVFAGRSLDMNAFCRVKVESHVRGEEYLVYLVDYSGREVISISNLRPLSASFCQLPAQALKAGLAGFQSPQNGDWEMGLVRHFRESVHNQTPYSIVSSTTDENVLQLLLIA